MNTNNDAVSDVEHGRKILTEHCWHTTRWADGLGGFSWKCSCGVVSWGTGIENPARYFRHESIRAAEIAAVEHIADALQITAEAEEPESVREEWFILGHPGWPGGIDFRTREQAEEHYWETPKLDGTRDGIRLMHRTITRYPEWVPLKPAVAPDA